MRQKHGRPIGTLESREGKGLEGRGSRQTVDHENRQNDEHRRIRPQRDALFQIGAMAEKMAGTRQPVAEPANDGCGNDPGRLCRVASPSVPIARLPKPTSRTMA